MLDHRRIRFDPSEIEGITVIRHTFFGLGLLARVQAGFAIGSLEDNDFQVHFFNPDEAPPTTFYIPNCCLRFDPSAVLDARQDPPLGALIVTPGGISMMVKPPRSAPSPLRVTGDPIDHPSEGVVITRWLIAPDDGLETEPLFRFDLQQGANSEKA